MGIVLSSLTMEVTYMNKLQGINQLFTDIARPKMLYSKLLGVEPTPDGGFLCWLQDWATRK